MAPIEVTHPKLTVAKPASGSTPNRGKLFSAFIFMIIAIMLVCVGVVGIGHYLLIDDPLEPATAVVVFGGHLPFRAMEAANLFRKGLVTEVWLTQGIMHAEDDALTKLGVHVIPEHEYSRQVLERMGVPPASIRVIDGQVDNTAQEVTVVAQEMRRVSVKRVILITSKYHTRRVQTILVEAGR
jgi:uncharacterized SAM-binding protein YcdF (DUF218 family)